MKDQKRYLLFVILVVTLAMVVVSCKKDEDEVSLGDWSKMSAFDGVARSDAVSFTLGGAGYLGTGYDGTNRLADFWKYNPDKNYWEQVADFPGSARNSAVAFSAGNKGYVGTGYDGDVKLADFYEYDPSNNSWTRKADFAGTARYGAVGFGLNDKGYIGTGFDGNYLKDFYEYSPAGDKWTKIISLGGDKRRDANAFTVGGKAYVVSGVDNGSYLTDLWMFDPATGEWTRKRDISNKSDETYDDQYTGISRINGVAFSISNKAYLCLGSSSALVGTTWEYDPAGDLWTERTEFEGTIRTEASGFGLGNFGYIVTGRSNTYYLDDIWRFDPTVEYNENE